jgi:hypothetical protein
MLQRPRSLASGVQIRATERWGRSSRPSPLPYKVYSTDAFEPVPPTATMPAKRAGRRGVMDAEQVKAPVRRFFEQQDEVRGGPTNELCDDAYAAYIPGGAPMNLEAHQRFSANFYAAVPDLEHSMEEVVA